MLKSFRFSNFKSWDNARIDCGKITGVFGTNSSGKTSLIQFLLLLKQTKDATDRATSLELNGNLIKLGSIKDAIHKHDEDREIEWACSFNRKSDIVLNDPTSQKAKEVARSKEFEVESKISVQHGAPVSTSLCYKIGSLKFSLTPREAGGTKFELSPDSTATKGEGFAFVRPRGRPWDLPGPVRSYAFPDQVRTYFQNASFLADLESAYEDELDNMFYLGPLRQYPLRDYLWARSRPTDVGQQGDHAIGAILAATQANEKRNLRPKARHMPFQQMVAHWLRELGLITSFEVTEIGRASNRWQVKVKTRAGGSEVLLTDVGFGVSQVLPVVTLLQYVPEGSIVILEQPEIHLHPLAQAALADVIIQAATHRNVQILLESHSEHLLLRLQRRIAEEVISSSDLKLYFCDARRGVSKLEELDIDLFGNIQNWPDRFMGDAFNEVATAELKRIERRAEQAAE